MSIEKRQSQQKTSKTGLGSGTYMAVVVSVLDNTFMGRLKVTLLADQGDYIGDDTVTYTLNYASPFFGHTPIEATGYNNNDFNDTQKSYGMWFVPPDVGVTVLCTFINGDPGKGFWFACLPPTFANHMVPAIGATTEVDLTDAQKKNYNTKQPLPVGEINKRHNKTDQEQDVEKIKKPVHPITDRFLEQGVIEDDVRGPTTSTSRRQVPNSVYGISTPGPLDYSDGSKRMAIGSYQSKSPSIPVSRLGGTQFVMDDGDDRFQRKTSPSTGPVEYADILAGEKGLPDIPYNEYTRLRTRTGHQLLMHNSEDLIYLGNSRGTAWIELTSNGKIDIFAADSISIHSENDLNIKADRDINVEAGRNINMKATAEYESPDVLHRTDDDGNIVSKIQDANEIEAGRIQIESKFNTNILIGANGKIETRKYLNSQDIEVDGELDISVIGSTRLKTGYGLLQPHKLEINVVGDSLITTSSNLDLNSGGNNAFTAGGTTDILSGDNHTETAAQIHMNGPTARTASTANDALVISDLITHDSIVTNTGAGWNPNKFQEGVIKSIMKRVPMHEPWAQHENLAPQFTNPQFTDRDVE